MQRYLEPLLWMRVVVSLGKKITAVLADTADTIRISLYNRPLQSILTDTADRNFISTNTANIASLGI